MSVVIWIQKYFDTLKVLLKEYSDKKVILKKLSRWQQTHIWQITQHAIEELIDLCSADLIGMPGPGLFFSLSSMYDVILYISMQSQATWKTVCIQISCLLIRI